MTFYDKKPIKVNSYNLINGYPWSIINIEELLMTIINYY